MKKPSITTITLKNLINVLLAATLLILLVTGFNFRTLTTKAIENQALAHAELVKAGLTAHMKAQSMDKWPFYLNEIKQLHEIKSLRIIRSDQVDKQFNTHLAQDISNDPLVQQAFQQRKATFLLDEFAIQPTIRAVVPYIALQQNNINCLSCHQVAEGSVLGGVDIILDVTEYRNHALWVLCGLTLLSIFAFILTYINTTRTISQHVQRPLQTLIDNAMIAYKDKQPFSTEEFKTREFSAVANEFNLFNSEILAHQELLRAKNAELLALNNEIESTLRETVFTMGVIEEKRSKETANHTKRVSLYSHLIATKMGLTPHQIDMVTTASPLHDIGKLGIPDEVLLKPGKLNDEERHIMKNHPNIGYAMLRHSSRDILQAAGIIAYQHHEKWDGSGYPQGLAGEQIHIYARIVALADVFDALYSSRIYKNAWPIEKIEDYIASETGKQFDPDVANIFIRYKDEFVNIYHQHPAESLTESDPFSDQALLNT